MSEHRFSIVQGRAVRDNRLTDSVFRTLSDLGMYTDKDGWCFPSQSTIAEDRGLSRQTINAHLELLEKLGYIESRNQFKSDGSQTSNMYRILFDLVQGVSNPDLTGGVKPRLDTNVPINDPFNDMASDKSSALPLSLENQIFVGKEITEIPNSNQADMVTSANLIATGTGILATDIYDLALTFMRERNIIIPKSKIKGNRKAAREMIEMHVEPEHIVQAVKELTENNMTCVDLFSVSKTAIGLANPTANSNVGKMFSL